MKFKPNDRIVIIGGGFAGIQFIKTLKNKPVRITLIDKQNFHTFQPLMYQVASARVEPAVISFPFRKLFQGYNNFDFRMAQVESVDAANKQVVTDTGNIKYDHLVIATGCTTNFFGNDEMKANALSMKELPEAIEIRNRILMDFEEYATATVEKEKIHEKEMLMNIIIVGAGPTGVELSGAFAELKKTVLPKDYPKIDFSNFDIYLLEGSEHTLNHMSDESKKMSQEYLEELGVRVKTGVLLKSYDGETAVLSTGETIPCKNVIWSAGVTGNVIPGVTQPENILRNRYIVDRYNLVKDTENIYALGDVAYMETPNYPKGHPQVANVAINQAKNLAKNIIKSLKNNDKLSEYTYKNMGMMATIGKNKAVVEFKKLKFQGLLAWFVWMFLHLMLILSVKNKLIIFINWAWAYITKDTSLRLIIKPKEDN